MGFVGSAAMNRAILARRSSASGRRTEVNASTAQLLDHARSIQLVLGEAMPRKR